MQAPNVAQISAEKARILADVSSIILAATASGISDKTHDSYWEKIPNGDPMPIGPATVSGVMPTPKTLDRMRAAVSTYLSG